MRRKNLSGTNMFASKIYYDPGEIDQRLQPFLFSRSELINVAQKTLAERSNTIELDVASAAGTLAYLHGNRHLRLLAASKGYEIKREKNVESSIKLDNGIMVAYQNVDLAASKIHSPRATSGKKTGSADIIDRAQGSLFRTTDIPEIFDLKKVHELNSSLWYFCVSFEEDSFSAELSLPASIKDENFSGFLERIIIAEGQQWFGIPSETSEEDYAEFEPKIGRK